MWREGKTVMMWRGALLQFISTRFNFFFFQFFYRSDICDPKSPVANWILCPTRRCDESFCGFTRVSDTCGLYRWTSAATFDRPGAVVFAVFMSFWGELWQCFLLYTVKNKIPVFVSRVYYIYIYEGWKSLFI